MDFSNFVFPGNNFLFCEYLIIDHALFVEEAKGSNGLRVPTHELRASARDSSPGMGCAILSSGETVVAVQS